ncbi:GGDEF domain-containing protein [Chromobacterium phragmitis]|uniref:Diguanylate cyclase DosC n=1 Tax=Chromobacterium phragmitis TaxID=2202141 RepID=A0A344UJ04_9NEIS|nr:GGDEF domain-containing protein [Chromobacterium phragmitis]AXE29860.1 GGDEF domain-containing protein [Chromobacterium phragmitis]AXE35252.1 GGDEF domain-containing protein [Chromobacterium phragmitis]
MKQTDQTLLEQLRITDFEIEQRKQLFALEPRDELLLRAAGALVESHLDELVARFYELQTSTPEIALLIGDADTLQRLRNAQRRYVIDLFSGVYDLEYVNNRLRIGLVHKRIGVEPKLYLAAVQTLKTLLSNLISELIPDIEVRRHTLLAVDKLVMFDVALVFETYIRSLVAEIETSRNKSEQYARSLEEKVAVRTRQLEELSRTDPLTGLLNRRYLDETLTRVLRSAQRRNETVTLVYLDVDHFKLINDSLGHQCGDEILRSLGEIINRITRVEDGCFRYGGDEFCIVLPNCDQKQAEETFVERLRAELAGLQPDISLSVGSVETGPEEFLSPESLVGMADQRMYEMKQRNRLREGRQAGAGKAEENGLGEDEGEAAPAAGR